jgi:glutamate dehydrogenase
MSQISQEDSLIVGQLTENRAWLERTLSTFFRDSMRDEPEAMGMLARELHTLRTNQHLILADRPNTLILATQSSPGSLLRTLRVRTGTERPISYAMSGHSADLLPGGTGTLEIMRLEFDHKTDALVRERLAAGVTVPPELRATIDATLTSDYPDFDRSELDRHLSVLWVNNPSYAQVSSPRRVAQTVRLLQRCERSGGMFFELERMQTVVDQTRVSLAVASPPHRGFYAQILEILNRLDLGVDRAYVLDLPTGDRPYYVSSFYVKPRAGGVLEVGSELAERLERELYNTQILSSGSPEYKNLVVPGAMSGEDAALVRAFVAFSHTQLAHAQPDRFDWEEVRNAFEANQPMSARMVELFRTRFEPGLADREALWAARLGEAERAVRDYNTGHKHLDDVRRDVFRCCLAFIRNTLKTNFFVSPKQAFAFRLDPNYLAELGPAFTNDLPAATPFRVTFFFTRYAFGYHIGFSDIARGGWRTVICRSDDDFLTNASTLFRENFVLAHTQHLKNKDIYEGGSKLVMLMDASALAKEERPQETLRLHKMQRAVINAFLDIYVTDSGVARHPSVVDYYREDEAIELGPDENMHDVMIEEIAQISKRRGYILGIGVMSSKKVGINHKEFAVTSTGVVKFAEITMRELNIDMHRDPFTVKFTGGPNGDVAGNAMNLILQRCPFAKIVLILDGTAALVDPSGADHTALKSILLQQDLHAFPVEALGAGAFILFRTGSRKDGLREEYRRVTRVPDGSLREEWLSLDDFSRLWGDLVFTVPADLFIPGGGRPETIDKDNWRRFLLPDGTPSAKAIIEGANSFITPPARVELQKAGAIVMRDASANKCGVISSSYEIIANLLLTEDEFLTDKPAYVRGVLDILEKRASDEARLILDRRRRTGALSTEISDAISKEINANYAHIYSFFATRPDLTLEAPFSLALLAHLPALLRDTPAFKARLPQLPPKYRAAILAAEIGSSMVYLGAREDDFEGTLRLHVGRHFHG